MIRGKSVIGIDLGATRIRGAVITGNGEIIDWNVEPTAPKGAEAVLGQINSIIENFFLKHKNIAGIGIGAIGIIDHHSGTVIVSTPNIEGWKGISLKNELQTNFDIPIKVENDVNLVTLGEFNFGKNQFHDDKLACIVLGTGAGIGIIINGHLFRQAHELGHMVVKFDGRTCSCGRSGCFEAYCSGNGIQSYYEQLSKETLSTSQTFSAQEVFKRHETQDPISTRIVLDFIQALSCSIANIVLTFSITDFVITGGISGSFSVFKDQVLTQSRARTMSNLGEFIILRKGSLNEYAGVLGAASLFFHDN
ncbi:MAG: ROK family protein [Chloroflexi bacterium]|nr:ROK family protein [Chloroflexota bacterium]